VGGVAPGVQIGDRHRLDPLAPQDRDRADERILIERRLDPSVGAQPLDDAEAQPARHQRFGRRLAQIVAVVLQTFAHLDDVAMARGRQQAELRALALDQRVGRHRRAVDDALGIGEQGREIAAERLRQQAQPVHDPFGRIGRGRGGLGQDRPAALVDRDEIGEGAADIDADADHDGLAPHPGPLPADPRVKPEEGEGG
jgi:hypothetical protein